MKDEKEYNVKKEAEKYGFKFSDGGDLNVTIGTNTPHPAAGEDTDVLLPANLDGQGLFV